MVAERRGSGRVFGTRHRNVEALRRRDDGRLEIGTRADGFALLAGPGTHTALPRTRLEVGVALGGRCAYDATLDANLAIEMIPMHDDGDARVGVDLMAFAGVVVGEETDVSRVDHDLFAQHHPRRRLSFGADARHYHRIGVRLISPRTRRVEP